MALGDGRAQHVQAGDGAWARATFGEESLPAGLKTVCEKSRPMSNLSTISNPPNDCSDKGSSALPMSKARCIALVATVTGAAFLNTLSIQCVVIILPTIGHELSVLGSRLQWIISSYSLTFGCFLLFWGRVADVYGMRLIFILGSVWVTIVTAINPFVPHEVAFDCFHGLHGLGAAANVPTAIGILGVTFPPGKAKNYAFSTYAVGAPLGNVFGNLVSGLIAEYSDWKWVFGASTIMAAVITVAGIIFIPSSTYVGSFVPATAHKTISTDESQITSLPSLANHAANTACLEEPMSRSSSPLARRRPLPPSIDWIGAGLITAGLIALMFALTEGNAAGWSTPWVPVTIVSSLLIIALFASWQCRLERLVAQKNQQCARRLFAPAPLVKASIFRNLRFSAVMLIMGLFFASFNNYLVYATYSFQDFQSLSPLQTMLRFIPAGATGVVIALIVAQLLDRVPVFFILVCGNLAVSFASLLFAVPTPNSTSYFALGLPAMILSVIGADTTWSCLTLFTSQALPREDQAIGGALINAVGQFGLAIGLAVSTAVQTAVMADARHIPVKEAGGIRPWEPESLRGLRAANWMNFGFGMASLAVVVAAFRSMEIICKTTSLPPGRSDGRDFLAGSPEAGVHVEARGRQVY